MAFAVICKSCQARFLLNDDLLRRKVAGRIVTVRCRQCQATIEVDASDVNPESPPAIPAAGAVEHKAARPAPPPPRPTAKSTLMGIGAPRPSGATELVALSPGFLDIKPAPERVASPHGFPDPPPPPDAVELLDGGDWEEVPPSQPEETAPESLDDFAEELPPSVPPEEEMPSSTGTPSLKALTHHDEDANKPRIDDFLANMTAAMNGGIISGAPTIDVSGLDTKPPAADVAPSIDVSNLETPVRGAKTLPLFSAADDEPTAVQPHPATPVPSSGAGLASPALPDRPATQASESDVPRERKNVVPPATQSLPPASSSRKPSSLAAPLLLALAAAAGFLIWKRTAAHAPRERLEAERPAERAPAPPAPPVEATPTLAAEPAAPPSAEAPVADVSFETTPNRPPPSTAPAATPAAASSPADKSAVASELKAESAGGLAAGEPKPDLAQEPTPPAEPVGPFDRAAAAAALNASAGQASACRKEGDPSGVASVVVTFAPSGNVTSANISGPPFAGTPTGGCIASTLRKTRIPAFEGERVTVSKTVVIQ